MSTLRIGSKTPKDGDARRTPAKPKKPAPTAAQQILADQEKWGDPYADPLLVDTSLSPELRASFVADVAIQLDGAMAELSTLTRKARRLADKLLDPALTDSPHREDAVQTSHEQDAAIADLVQRICLDEARADRHWQSLTIADRERARLDMLWNVAAHSKRLAGAAWLVMGKQYEWPPGWRLRREWLAGLPLVVILDLRAAGAMDWEPNPYPPSVFDGTKTRATPIAIARQISKPNGDPL